MTERTITTTIEWGVEYRWPDGYTQIVWYDGDRQCAEGDIRMHGVNGPRIETARLVTRTVTVTVTSAAYVDPDVQHVEELHAPGPFVEFDLGPLVDDDPTVVVPAEMFQRAPQ